jgi:hypothetical protein
MKRTCFSNDKYNIGYDDHMIRFAVVAARNFGNRRLQNYITPH